jgi:tryptophan-rich sensory protein
VGAAAAVGGLAARAAPGDLYERLDTPSWAPPSWLVSPMWTALYVAMAIGLRAPTAALVDIAARS